MTVDDYIAKVPSDRLDAFLKLRMAILKTLPKGFVEDINNGMIGYVVPHTIYPNGYHCKPSDPVPFINIASNKTGIVMYHMGLYANKNLTKWFIEEYSKVIKHKIDMGKSCIKFKYLDEIPYALISELVSKINVKEWLTIYEQELKKK